MAIVIQPSGLAPHKTIYAGHARELEDGQIVWKDKEDVTEQVVTAAFDHLIAKGEIEDFNQITFNGKKKITVTIEDIEG